MSKPGKSLKTLCKKLGVRLTVKRGKKRVYKSVKVLKSQCERKRKVVKRKRRRRKFGTGTPEQGRPDSVETPRTVGRNPNAITPGYWDSPPGWLSNSPGPLSPIPLDTDSDSESDEEESDFTLQLPPRIVRRRLDFSNMFGKKKKVKRRKKVKNKKKVKRKRRRRKFGKKSKKKSVDIVSFAKKNKIPLGIAATILSSVGIGYYIKNRKPSEEQLFKEFINIPDSDKLEYLAKQDRKTKEQLEKLHAYREAVVRVWQNIMNNNNTPEIKEIKDKFLAEAEAEQTSRIKTNKNLSKEEEKAAMDSFLLIKMFPLTEKVVKKYNKNFPDYEEFKKNYF